MEEYDLEFSRLARFSPAYVSSNELKAERFISGQREDLKGNVTAQSSSIMRKPFRWRPSSTRPTPKSYNWEQHSHPTLQPRKRGQTVATPELVDHPVAALINEEEPWYRT